MQSTTECDHSQSQGRVGSDTLEMRGTLILVVFHYGMLATWLSGKLYGKTVTVRRCEFESVTCTKNHGPVNCSNEGAKLSWGYKFQS